ncbi:MAG: esterase-like activity of phytase family protein [Pseudomonadota bacterium]
MTWRTTPLALCTALALWIVPGSLAAQEVEDLLPQTEPVPLNADDPAAREVGELIYRGGLKIEPGEEKIGGISGLEWFEDALWAVADDGRWMRIVPDEANAELRDIYGMDIGALRDPKGKKLKGNAQTDAEALTRNGKGGWLVAFERDHRVWRYDDLSGPAKAEDRGPMDQLTFVDANSGMETLAQAGEGGFVCVEGYGLAEPNCLRLSAAGLVPVELAPPTPVAEHGGAPTDAACVDDGTCYVLFRSYKPGYGNRTAIVELSTGNEATTLALFDAPLTRDNFEGLAVREQFGKRYLYLASDDNFNNCYERERGNCQDTLLMKFEIKSDEPPPAQVVDAPEPDPQYETTDVVLETAIGEITIALEVERAPITAANFLRYVEEGRFDGTVFYRAMSLDREPKPNGLLQGGTQFDPKRILPGIEHEPTTKTGLSHTNGALSMAMLEPGSANGDFSIMLQDQTGLDARPEDPDPIWQNGYAVFGYVIDGMDVVAAIHQSPTDPDKGEGAMRGQILADPVEIVKARRVDEPEAQPKAESNAG